MAERSVTAAANRLGKTPSAVSHALRRMREQWGDPVMVKMGGKMHPSPFALRLSDEVRPILGAIQRAVAPPAPFDPADSRRCFRVAMASFSGMMSRIYEQVNAQAPHVLVEWTNPQQGVLTRLAEGLVDLVMLGDAPAIPEGVSREILPPLRVLTFARSGHPALSNWSRAEWQRWPHIRIDLGGGTKNTVDQRSAGIGLERTFGAYIPDFGAIAPLLAWTNFLANSFYAALGDGIDVYDLQALRPPLGRLEGAFALYWNTGLARDPGIDWLRGIVTRCFNDMVHEADARFADREVLPPAEDQIV